MSEPYLIAHKVRGEPAFDIAERMECPHCHDDSHDRTMCVECDGLGYWWIIPTSGHRAYTWRWWPLAQLRIVDRFGDQDFVQPMDEIVNGVPDEIPDHYHLDAPPTRRVNLAEALGLTKPKPAPAPIHRRL